MEQKLNEKYQEILRLDRMLTEAGIPHVIEPYFEAWSVSYPSKERPAIWVLCMEQGFDDSNQNALRLIGYMSMERKDICFTYGDDITVDYIFKIIKEHYTTYRKVVGADAMKIVLDKGAFTPERAHDTDAGLDLRTPIDVTIPPRGSAVINTGVHVELPPNTAGMLKSKSGLNVKCGITSEGVIDVGYTGAIVAKLYNNGNEPFEFKRGDKITQLVILPVIIPEVEVVDSLNETERGNNGFGSSGR